MTEQEQLLDGLLTVMDADGNEIWQGRLSAVMEGRNDPGYNPPDYPLIVDDDPADPDVKADH